MSSTCVFCDIVAGVAPASVVYGDELAVAFLDLFPVHAGHTLVVPRRHVVDLTSCPEAVASHLFAVCSRLGPRIVEEVGAAGFNVWTANGAAAGQEIFHLHLHILPRYNDDAFGLRFPKSYPREASRQELEVMAASLRKRM